MVGLSSETKQLVASALCWHPAHHLTDSLSWFPTLAAAGSSASAVPPLPAHATPELVCVLEGLPSGALVTRDDLELGALTAADVARCGISPGDLVLCTADGLRFPAPTSLASPSGGAAYGFGVPGTHEPASSAAASSMDTAEEGSSAADAGLSIAGAPTLTGLTVVAKEPDSHRVHADLFSRILFNHQLAQGTAPTIADLASAVSRRIG